MFAATKFRRRIGQDGKDMAAPRKYSDEQRAALCVLVNDEGHTPAQAVELLANGFEDIPPASIPEDYARQIVRQDRQRRGPSLNGRPLPEALDVLARQAFRLANRELAHMHARQGNLDADAFLKIARALKELQPLALTRPPDPDKASSKADEPTWIGALNLPN